MMETMHTLRQLVPNAVEKVVGNVKVGLVA